MYEDVHDAGRHPVSLIPCTPVARHSGSDAGIGARVVKKRGRPRKSKKRNALNKKNKIKEAAEVRVIRDVKCDVKFVNRNTGLGNQGKRIALILKEKDVEHEGLNR